MPTLNEMIRVYFENLIRETSGNLALMAKISGLGRATVYRVIAKYELWEAVRLSRGGAKV